MRLDVQGITSVEVNKIRQGGLDANGQTAQLHVTEGLANPCRHCLELIPEGDPMLVLAYRPFDALQPYAEVGPIFLHQKQCEHYNSDALPRWFDFLEPAIIRGYNRDHWIKYETGTVIPGRELTTACQSILSDPDIAYVHIRSKFNCFQCQVRRG